MKLDRHRLTTRPIGVKLRRAPDICRATGWISLLVIGPFVLFAPLAGADDASVNEPSVSRAGKNLPETNSQPQATELLRNVLQRIAHGPAFDAKVRETVWTTGREVVGVGTYEQAGRGTGRFNLQVTMHDGDGKHHLQQISDGRLAWTRSEVAGAVTLRRVDVGRLDEWVRQSATPASLEPRLKIGGWTEMLDTIARDYVLQLDNAKLKSQPVWVITGTLRDDVRRQVLADSNREHWPPLFPTRIRVAIALTPDAETGFGQFLPSRIEFWSDPVAADDDAQEDAPREGRLITLIEIYSVRQISPPQIERFRFENQDAEVNFQNETDRYIRRFGVELTASQKRLLQR